MQKSFGKAQVILRGHKLFTVSIIVDYLSRQTGNSLQFTLLNTKR
jgi:hypothetical protein